MLPTTHRRTPPTFAGAARGRPARTPPHTTGTQHGPPHKSSWGWKRPTYTMLQTDISCGVSGAKMKHPRERNELFASASWEMEKENLPRDPRKIL
eukprot:2250444-Prymnesium_polylepis.1